jgi:putative DNA primase/helicase
MTPIELVLSKLSQTRKINDRWQACCPAHDDQKPSLGIAVGDDGRVLLNCYAGCETSAVVSALGLSMKDLMPHTASYSSPRTNGKTAKTRLFDSIESAIAHLDERYGKHALKWVYKDESGNAVGAILRWNKPDGKKDIRPITRCPGGWRIGGMAAPRPPYRLADIKDGEQVIIVEGERAADTAAALGFAVTSSAGGSNAAKQTDWSVCAGRTCIILPDNDKPGRKYAHDVISCLSKLRPQPAVKIVDLPELPEHGDIIEYVEACKSKGMAENEIVASIDNLIEAAAPVEPNEIVDDHRPAPVLKRLAEVQPEPMQWLWPGLIALGKLSLLVGDPGLGKSFLTLDIAARVSTGRSWPGLSAIPNPQGSVVLLSAEDDLADTIRPRLDAANANPHQIASLESVSRPSSKKSELKHSLFCLRSDVAVLEEAIRQMPRCRLIVIDPITAYLGGTDSHKNTDVRELLTPLADLAARHRVAILGVTHLNKNVGGPAIYRSMGSLAFTAAARSVLAVAKAKDDPQRRLLLPVKNNLAIDQSGMAFSIRDGKVAWEDSPVHIQIDDALCSDIGHRGKPSERDRAADWIREWLADGPKPSTDIIADAREHGIAEKTLRRAFADIGGEPDKQSFEGGWYWKLPDQPDLPQDDHK